MPAFEMPPPPLDGGCRCGAVRLRIEAVPMLTMACHCRGCQRMTACAFSTSIAVPSAGFRVTAGETVIGGVHGDQLHHHHCSRCNSWLFTRIEPDPGFVNVRATMLDEASWFVPFIETQVAEALPWARTPAKYHFERFPPMEAYGELIAAFADR